MSTYVQAVSDDSFETDVIESKDPVLVDFWASWCNPCKTLAPIFEDLAKQYEGKVKFLKMDVEANPNTPPKFAVHGIPTLILFKNGQEVANHIGLLSKNDLSKFIDSHI